MMNGSEDVNVSESTDAIGYERLWYNAIFARQGLPLKLSSGSTPSLLHIARNQETPTATCANSSSTIFWTMLAVFLSPIDSSFSTSLGPASSPLAS